MFPPSRARSRALVDACDAALAGRGQQRAIFRVHVHESVTEPALDGVHPNVEQHPLGGNEAHDAQRVVEAVATTADAERLADTHRHEVAQHGERSGVDALLEAGDPRPHDGLTVALRTVEVFPEPPLGEPLVESLGDRSLHLVAVGARGALLGTDHRRHAFELTGDLHRAVAEGRVQVEGDHCLVDGRPVATVSQ